MRALSWMALGGLTLACGGSAFTGVIDASDDGGASGGGSSNSGAAGRGGGSGGKGGKPSTGGSALGGSATAGAGRGGASTTGGAQPIAGEPGVAGGTSEPPDTSCPMSPPKVGGACKDGLICSYGSDVRLDCRPRAQCKEGKWTFLDPDCQELQTCTSSATPNNPCDKDGESCVKDNGQYCQCTACIGMVCSPEPIWQCTTSSNSADCPKIAPNQGQPCQGARKCQYGSCGLGEATPAEASCDGETWSYEMVACPL